MRTRNMQKATAAETDILLDIVSSHFLLQARSHYAHLLSSILSAKGIPGEELRVAQEVLLHGEIADMLSTVHSLVSTYDATSDMLDLFQSSGIELLRTYLRSGFSRVNVIAISFPDGIVHCFLGKGTGSLQSFTLHATIHIKEANPYGILTSIAAHPFMLSQLCSLCKSLGAQEVFVAYELQSHDVMNIMASANIWLTAKGFVPVGRDTLRLLPFPRKIHEDDDNTTWVKAVQKLQSFHPRAIAADLRRLAEVSANTVSIEKLCEYASRSTTLKSFANTVDRQDGCAQHLISISQKTGDWPILHTLKELGTAVRDLQEFPFFNKKL